MGMWRSGHSEPFIGLTQWWMSAALCPMAYSLSFCLSPLSYWNACSFLLWTSRENRHAALFTAFHGCHASLINFEEDKYFSALLVIEWSMNLHGQQILMQHIISFFSRIVHKLELHSICDKIFTQQTPQFQQNIVLFYINIIDVFMNFSQRKKSQHTTGFIWWLITTL